MPRTPKPSGQKGRRPVYDDKEFISRARVECDIIESDGSHFKARHRKTGATMEAYHLHNGDRYGKGIGHTLAEWLQALGLCLALAGSALALAWLFF